MIETEKDLIYNFWWGKTIFTRVLLFLLNKANCLIVLRHAITLRLTVTASIKQAVDYLKGQNALRGRHMRRRLPYVRAPAGTMSDTWCPEVCMQRGRGGAHLWAEGFFCRGGCRVPPPLSASYTCGRVSRRPRSLQATKGSRRRTIVVANPTDSAYLGEEKDEPELFSKYYKI